MAKRLVPHPIDGARNGASMAYASARSLRESFSSSPSSFRTSSSTVAASTSYSATTTR
jgi:hypothetical protein